jgi:thioredoxin-related protein
MKNLIVLVLCALPLFAAGQQDTSAQVADSSVQVTDKVKWLTWTEAVTLQKLQPRKIFVHVYADWCVWCKKMDVTTYQDSALAMILNTEYYAVKFDAEMKEDMEYRGFVFKYEQTGDKGYHQFAVSLLNGEMSYPALVILDETENRINIMRGYRTEAVLAGTLSYFADNGHTRPKSQQFGVGYNFQCKNPVHRHGNAGTLPPANEGDK